MKYFLAAAFLFALGTQQYIVHKVFKLNERLQDVVMRNLNVVDAACLKRK